MSQPIKIVAFGDSLTAGAQAPSPGNPMGESTPYGIFLKEMLGETAEVFVSGISGELTDQMIMRLGRNVLPLKPDYVVVLGGTNDLGWNSRPREIMKNLVAIYERIRGGGAEPVAVTVPSILGFDALIPPRQELNDLIMEYCRGKDQHFIDLFQATAEPETLRLSGPLTGDGLHLTTEGYRRIAELLYEEVFSPLMNKKD